MIRLLSWIMPRRHLFRERFDKSPLDTVAATENFVRTRASYIAQTSLYGYLKTRMGTQYRAFFEDEVFSHSIRISAGKLFASCLSDLTIYSVAHIVQDSKLPAPRAQGLAGHFYKNGLRDGLEDIAPEERPAGTEAAFKDRIASVDWPQMAEGRAAFLGSETDLIRFAPVIDEYKKLDDEIVTNSIRFRWTDVRSQFRKRITPAAVARDWLEQGE